MECRICLEITPPFLDNVCACRGSQQYVHESCLLSWIRVKPTGICDVCRQAFAITIAKPVLKHPYFHSILFSQRFFNWVATGLLILFFSSLHRYIIYVQYFLFGLYTDSYIGLLSTVWQQSPYYIWLWLHPILFLPSGQILYPLPSIGLFLLPNYIPVIYCLSQFQGIWKVHVGILEYIDSSQ